MCLKKIHPGSFFPDQQLYTRISVSTKYAAGSFMNDDLKTPAAPSEADCVYDKGKDESWKLNRFIHVHIVETPLLFPLCAVSGVGKMQTCVGVNSNPRRLCLRWKTDTLAKDCEAALGIRAT